MLTSKEVALKFIEGFDRHDVASLTALYAEDAVNWQVADVPLEGRTAIRAGFDAFFRAFPDSFTRVVNILADSDWAAVEWEGGGTFSGPLGDHRPTGKAYKLRGCGFLQVQNGLIVRQRGYWDRISWFRQIGIPY
jgi:steroid delta-isomerase-like uncharacterized protein